MRKLITTCLGISLVVGAPALADDEPQPEEKKQKDDWSVMDPGVPSKTVSFETSEGTWISVDVHPDGTRLVFDLVGDLYTLPIAGGTATRLTSGLAYDVQPRWSPDGSKVLFTSDRGGGDNVWWMPAEGGEAKAITNEDYRLFNNGVWHPSGDYVIAKKHFTSRRSLGAGEMWMMRFPEGGKGVQLTKRKNDQQDAGEPAISPDGGYLYWSEDMSGGKFFEYNKNPNETIYVIRRLDLESGEITDLIRRPGGAIRPEVSPDGKTLAFVRRKRNHSVLSLFDLATGEMRDLWDGLSVDQQETWAIFGPYPGFDWTPDGKGIVVWARGRLHRVDVASGKAAEIPFKAQVDQKVLETRRIDHSLAGDTFDVKVVRWPQVTPGGKWCVFQALGHLHKRDLATGAVSRVTGQEDEFEFAPRLSPNGKSIVYTTWSDTEGGRVKQVGLDGSGVRTLVDRPGHYVSAALSADGKEVVYHRSRGDGYRGHRFAEDPGIYRQKVGADARPRFLTRSGREPRFSADGRRVFLFDREGENGALVSVDRIGSDRRVHATSEQARDFELSPDGKWLAFEELWQTYVVPMPPGPGPIDVSAEAKHLPVVRLSGTSGTYLAWSADSRTIRWSLGPDLFAADVASLYPRPDKKEKDDEGTKGVGATAVRIGFEAPVDNPDTDIYLVGGRIAPMHDHSIIEDGVVHVRGNRIVAVGTRDEVDVPDDATTIDVSGKTVMPGLMDVHSHTGSAASGIQSQQNWAFLAMLSFGVTTVHDPSNDTQGIYAESELVRSGARLGPRVLSTGTILYGAEGNFKAVVNSYDDALQEIARTTAWGPVSVKSYNQPRRDQRQQVIKAARELGIMVMPEGGSTLHYNITHLLDGHTTLEHAIPVAPLYEPELRLLSEMGTCYTPTLVVGYGGLWGENYWYAKTEVWKNERLLRFVPRSVVDPRARRRTLATDEDDYHHMRLAATCAEVYRRGGTVEIGAHGQLQGLGSHWETWMLHQGGLSAHEALRCATWGGARAICLDHELGALRPGYLADLIVVDGNPLEVMRDSEKVVYTMANGRLYDAQTLDQLHPVQRKLPAGPPLDTIRGDMGMSRCACGR